MEIIPNSELYICNDTNLNSDYNWTIDFNNADEQLAYFESKQALISINDPSVAKSYSYIRNNTININEKLENLIGCDYLYFNNNGKYWFAFITSKRYRSTYVTELTIKIDVLQTFMFDEYEIKESFIEREHQDRWDFVNKKPLFNTKDEGINYGSDYVTKNTVVKSPHKLKFIYILTTSPITTGQPIVENDYGLPTGFYCYFTAKREDSSDQLNWTDTVGDKILLSQFNQVLTNTVLSEKSIFQVFESNIAPWEVESIGKNDFKFKVNKIGNRDYYCDCRVVKAQTSGDYSINLCQILGREKFGEIPLTQINKVLGYNEIYYTFPKSMENETKLNVYPYNFFKLKYGVNEGIYKIEYSNGATVNAFQSLSNEATSLIYVNNDLFKEDEDTNINIQQAISNQMPLLINLVTDPWKQYLLQNKNQRQAGFINTGLNVVGGIASGIGGTAVSGNPLALVSSLGNVISSGQQVMNLMAKEKDIKNQPNDPRLFNGDISLMHKMTNGNPVLTEYDVTPEYKKQLFEYFYHYGYKCNEFKIPNLKSRYRFNYIKTVGVNIKSSIDQDFINEICNIYNNGITIWHCRDLNNFEVNNYEKENTEMSYINTIN